MNDKIYNYIFNLRNKAKSLRKNYFLSHRRIARGDGHKTMGWILSDDNKDLAERIKFQDIMEVKRKIENV